MEVVLYGALTSIWWISSATVLLPFLCLLKYSKFFRDRWFSYIFTKCLNIYFEPKMAPMRKKAFDLLKENLSQSDQPKPLKILEIGVGSGANFQFYPENSHLTALDMNVSFDSYFKENQKKFPNIVYERSVLSVAENMKDIDDCSMDVVISTYVLCSVTSVNDVLNETKRVLKPGGKFLFLEHVGYPASQWSSTIQKFADPLWKIYFGGCCLTRHNDDAIKAAGFSNVICKQLIPPASSMTMLYVRSQVYGLATK